VLDLDIDLLRSLLIFFGMFVAAGLGAPIPEELAMVAAGLWTATSPEHGPARWLMLPVCLLGVLIADILLYGIGRLYGTRLLEHRWLAHLMPPEKRLRIERNFNRYGVNILLVGRLLPGIRAPLFVTAGTMRLPIPKFVLADALGAVLGNSLLFFLAFWFGDQFKELIESAERGVARFRTVLILAGLAGVAIFLLIQFLRRPVPTGDPKDLPIIGSQVAAHMPHTKDDEDGEAPPTPRPAPRTVPAEQRESSPIEDRG
jgi:membrane protein DedA with SNARE-associated domain